MPTILFTPEESSRRARAFYESIRSIVDTPENNGLPILVNVETGEYEIDREDTQRGNIAMQRHIARNPNAQIHALRIGWPAFGKMGGNWSARIARIKTQGDNTGTV